MPQYQTPTYLGKLSLPRNYEANNGPIRIPIVLPAVALVAGDLINLIDLDPGVAVDDWCLLLDKADTNGAPAIAFSLGTSLLTTDTDLTGAVWKTAITIGQNGGVQRMDNTTAWLENGGVSTQAYPSGKKKVSLKCTTAGATYSPNKTGLLILQLRG